MFVRFLKYFQLDDSQDTESEFQRLWKGSSRNDISLFYLNIFLKNLAVFS